IDFAEDAHQGRPLLRKRNYNLWVDRAILDAIYDILLNFAVIPTGSPNGASIWNADIAIIVDRLVGNRDEVTGSHTGLGRDEQSARRRFEYRHADDVADAEFNLGRWPELVREDAREPARLIPAEDRYRFRRQ